MQCPFKVETYRKISKELYSTEVHVHKYFAECSMEDCPYYERKVTSFDPYFKEICRRVKYGK